jgi:hypothetical protein
MQIDKPRQMIVFPKIDDSGENGVNMCELDDLMKFSGFADFRLFSLRFPEWTIYDCFAITFSICPYRFCLFWHGTSWNEAISSGLWNCNSLIGNSTSFDLISSTKLRVCDRETESLLVRHFYQYAVMSAGFILGTSNAILMHRSFPWLNVQMVQTGVRSLRAECGDSTAKRILKVSARRENPWKISSRPGMSVRLASQSKYDNSLMNLNLNRCPSYKLTKVQGSPN